MTAGAHRRVLRIGGGLAALAGLGATVALIAYQGFAEVGGVMLAAGWGIALVTAFHLVPTAAAAAGWRAVAGAVGPPVSRSVFLWARLLRESVNGLLPVAQLGGDVVGARVLTLRGTPARVAGASVLADVTVEVLAQLAFTIVGLGLLLADGGGRLAVWAGAGLAVAALAVGGFLLAQRRGVFLLMERWLRSMADRMDWPALGSLTNLHDTVLAIYRHRPAMVGASVWHLATWLLDAVELWLTFRILGADVGFADALVIESLGQALRSAAFLVPGALGIQEGGYMLLGMHFGLAPEVALSASLIKRARELVLGVPAILVWQFGEGRRLFATLDSAMKEKA